jgi:hypothetical protein
MYCGLGYCYHDQVVDVDVDYQMQIATQWGNHNIRGIVTCIRGVWRSISEYSSKYIMRLTIHETDKSLLEHGKRYIL